MKTLFLLCFSFFLASSAANERSAQINVGCTVSTPPYVIKENDRGITLDILHQIGLYAGLSLRLHYAPNAQNTSLFKEGQLDILCVANPETASSAYFSHYPIVSYQNVAISLSKNQIKLHTSADLSRYSIQSFSLARTLLGPAYASAVQKSPSYAEEENQLEQVRALFKGNTEVIILDKTTFRYYLSQLRRADPINPDFHQPYDIQEIFPATTYYAAFHQEQLRNQFDSAFKKLKENGDEKRIIENYERLLENYLFTR